jgi:hypothetical protein
MTGKDYSAINKNSNNSVDYLHQTFNKPFPNVKYQYTSIKEIEKKKSVLRNKKIHMVTMKYRLIY